MKNAFLIAFKLYYKYFLILYAVLIFGVLIYDDWYFFQSVEFNYPQLFQRIKTYLGWYFMYLPVVSLTYYWIPATVGILIYHKLIKRN